MTEQRASTPASSAEPLKPGLRSERASSTTKERGFQLKRQLRWLIAARLMFLTGTALIVFLVELSTGQLATPATAPLLRVAGAGLLLSVVYMGLMMALSARPVLQAYIQCLGDLLLVSALVYETGGLNSPFSMMYLMVIAVAAVVLRRRAGVTIAEVAWILYAAVTIGLFKGWLSNPAGSVEASSGSLGRLAYSLFVHLIGFYGVALLTSILGRQVSRAERQLEATTENLEDLEIFHRDVVESMSSGLALLDLQDRVIGLNRIGREILDQGPDFEGLPFLELGLLTPEHWTILRQEAGSERVRDEVAVRDRHGETKHVGFSVGVINDSEGRLRGHTVVFQELTEWRRLQAQLNVKERMAAVGELAAGLAHELGNPLAAISGSVQMLQASGDPSSAQAKLLDIVLKESRRLDRTIKSFLSFARPQDRHIQRFDIAQLIRENVDLLGNSEERLPTHELVTDLEPPRVDLVADRDQISQVFWNLARNALRAMPKGGTLTVRGRVTDRRYSLRFEDTGVGMTNDQVHGLFHPFRSYQGGTGIGMAIVYRIVEEHQGQINVESQIEAGTAIEINLPLDGALASASGFAPAPAAHRGNDGNLAANPPRPDADGARPSLTDP